MYQWRDMMAGGGAVAMPRGFVRVAPFGARKRVRFSLVVDLAAEPLSVTWWRGAATLGLLCASAGVLAPTFEPLSGATSERPSEAAAREYRDIGVAPLTSGGRSGGRMVASDRVEPLLIAPERAQVELDARLSDGDRIEALLMRIGAVPGDAMTVGRMVHAAAPRGLDGGTASARTHCDLAASADQITTTALADFNCSSMTSE